MSITSRDPARRWRSHVVLGVLAFYTSIALLLLDVYVWQGPRACATLATLSSSTVSTSTPNVPPLTWPSLVRVGVATLLATPVLVWIVGLCVQRVTTTYAYAYAGAGASEEKEDGDMYTYTTTSRSHPLAILPWLLTLVVLAVGMAYLTLCLRWLPIVNGLLCLLLVPLAIASIVQDATTRSSASSSEDAAVDEESRPRADPRSNTCDDCIVVDGTTSMPEEEVTTAVAPGVVRVHSGTVAVVAAVIGAMALLVWMGFAQWNLVDRQLVIGLVLVTLYALALVAPRTWVRVQLHSGKPS